MGRSLRDGVDAFVRCASAACIITIMTIKVYAHCILTHHLQQFVLHQETNEFIDILTRGIENKRRIRSCDVDNRTEQQIASQMTKGDVDSLFVW